jgi:hypothetical protein
MILTTAPPGAVAVAAEIVPERGGTETEIEIDTEIEIGKDVDRGRARDRETGAAQEILIAAAIEAVVITIEGTI